jgi:hypothetical protein
MSDSPVPFGHRYQALRKAMRVAGMTFDKDIMITCDHILEGGAHGIHQYWRQVPILLN